MLPKLRRSTKPGSHSWLAIQADALAVADLNGLVTTPGRIEHAAQTALRAYGGPEGVRAELSRRQAGPERDRHRVEARIEWARRTVQQLGAVSTA